MNFRAGQHHFTFPCPAVIMGIVNVTPDSFSDGGEFFDPERAVAHGLHLVEQGAGMLDIGGESTRPGAEPVSEAEELKRVLPVIKGLAGQVKVPLSVDTVKPSVAEAALAAGACIVNDVSANRTEDAMWRLVASSGAGYVCMHMQGTPQSMQENPKYEDVVTSVKDFFRERLEKLAQCGVEAEQVVLDVGIGFGKTLEHNLQLLAELGTFRELRRPMLLGASRKSFIGRLTGAEVSNRMPGSLACACLAVAAGVQIIRTHDVAETIQAARVMEAVSSRKNKANAGGNQIQ